MRRHKGSEVRLNDLDNISPTELDEAKLLHKADLDQMTSEFALSLGILSLRYCLWSCLPNLSIGVACLFLAVCIHFCRSPF